MLRQKMMIPMLAATLIGGGLLGTGLVMAQDNTDPKSSLVSKIAQKFNLNQADVQAVFDTDRQDHMKQMQANFEQKLNQAVKDGKITEVQKTAILAKLAEMKNNHPDPSQFKNMTEDQRKQAMEQKKSEMNSWLSANGLTEQTVRELTGPMAGGFGRHGGMRGMKPSASPQI